MNPIDPAELSAYLDGELDPARAAEVDRAVAADPTLRAEFERLRTMDAAWTVAARSAVARPKLRMVSSAFDSRIGIGIALLVALRFLPKLGDLFFWGIVLHAVVLVVVLVWIARVARIDALGEPQSG